MVGWEVAQPTTTAAMGVTVEILPTRGAAMLPQISTVLVMAMVQHLVQTITARIGMEKAVDTVDMEDKARLPIPLVIHREMVLQVIIMVVQRRAGAGVEGGDPLFLQRYILDLY